MAAAAVMIVAAAVAAYAQYRQGKAQEEAMEYEAKMHEQEGEYKMMQANREAVKHREAVRRLIASQRAHMAASGVDISTGSPLELFSQTAFEGEMDAQDIIYAGKIGKDTSGMAANLSRFKGSQAKIAGRWSAAATMIGGAGSAVGSYNSGSTE